MLYWEGGCHCCRVGVCNSCSESIGVMTGAVWVLTEVLMFEQVSVSNVAE
jgi:hypothetical protein